MEQGTARARLDLDADDRVVRLRQELGVSSFGINLLLLRPGQRGRIHRHRSQEEVYLVLEGTLTLLVEGEPVELRRGELIRVAPELRRQLTNAGPENLAVLALGGGGEHAGRDATAFGSWEDAEGGPPQEIPVPEDLELSG